MIDVSEPTPVELGAVVIAFSGGGWSDSADAASKCIRSLRDTPNIWRLNVEAIRKLAKSHRQPEGKVVVRLLVAWFTGLKTSPYHAVASVWLSAMSMGPRMKVDPSLTVDVVAADFKEHKRDGAYQVASEYAVDAQIALHEYVEAWNRKHTREIERRRTQLECLDS